ELPGISLDEILGKTVLLLPLAWQFPEITEASIVLEGRAFQTVNFRETSWMQACEIIVNGIPSGQVVVCYLEERQGSGEGPFLQDEQKLLDAITERLGHIIERKRAEGALAGSEEKIRLLLNSAAEAIYGLDMNGNCTFCNASCLRQLGYKHQDELLGRNMHWQIHAKHPDGTPYPVEECPIFRAFNKGEGTHVDDEVLWRADGTSFPAEYWSYPQRHHDVVVGAVVTFMDITERKELENEREYHEQELMRFSTALTTANRKLNLLSSITRHDINNQLTVQMGYLEILEDMPPGPSRDEYFQKVLTAAERISAMIRFTREYEQIGVSTPAWQDCRSLVDTAAQEAPLGKVIVKNDLPAGMEMFADPLVVKVFYNLMDNAVRYGGKITFIRFSGMEHVGSHAVVCEDDGDGVVVDEKVKIFDRGFGKNTGLGLALSREILDITGITIKETGEPGQGARFELTLPKDAWRIMGVGNE
ncbi:MAG: ATP-binding protein, partial [Methanomicrobiales archaeon]